MTRANPETITEQGYRCADCGGYVRFSGRHECAPPRLMAYSRLVDEARTLENLVYNGRGKYDHLRPRLRELHRLIDHRARNPIVFVPAP